MKKYTEAVGEQSQQKTSPKNHVVHCLEEFGHALAECKGLIPAEQRPVHQCLELLQSANQDLKATVEKDWPQTMKKRPYEAPRIISEGNLADWRKGSPFPLLTPEQLTHAAHAAKSGASVPPAVLAELVRLYRQISNIGELSVALERIEAELERQVQIADGLANAILRGARNRFSVLLQWVSANPEFVHTRWHEVNELRWAGTYDEASEIVRTQYGPRRGLEAYVVVEVET